MDDAPKLVNPSGWVTEGSPHPVILPNAPEKTIYGPPVPEEGRHLSFVDEEASPSSGSSDSATDEVDGVPKDQGYVRHS